MYLIVNIPSMFSIYKHSACNVAPYKKFTMWLILLFCLRTYGGQSKTYLAYQLCIAATKTRNTIANIVQSHSTCNSTTKSLPG